MEQKLECQNALLKQLLQDAGWEADVEDLEPKDSPPTKKKSKMSSDRVLTRGIVLHLTERQKKTCKELLVSLLIFLECNMSKNLK